MCFQRFVGHGILAVLAAAVIGAAGRTADWPQYMRDACHTADARDERLRLPLHVAASVRLDDAVLTSPAVVAGRLLLPVGREDRRCLEGGCDESADSWRDHRCE